MCVWWMDNHRISNEFRRPLTDSRFLCHLRTSRRMPMRRQGDSYDSLSGEGDAVKRPRRRKNILFITADQWRGDCLSCVGHPVVKTPNLAQLAGEGTLFTRNFANALPCAPSRASIHTGTYQLTHRVVINGTPLDSGRLSSWAAELRKHGRDPVLLGYTDTTWT